MFLIFYLMSHLGWGFSGDGTLLLVRNGIDTKDSIYEQALWALRVTVALMFGAIYST